MVVSYFDPGGIAESVTSVPTAAVTDPNANAAPIVDLNGSSPGTGVTLQYVETLPATSIAPLATLSDATSPNLNGGSLAVAFTANGISSDQLTILNQGNGAGHIGVNGNTVSYGGVAIGTFSGGSNGNALIVNFTSNAATPAAVQALIRDVQFSNLSVDLQSPSRIVTFTVIDGDGVANGGDDIVAVTATVNVNVYPQVALTVNSDTFSGDNENPKTVTADASTLTSGDVLVGGGNDVLVLYNSGSFDLAHLAEFSGFSQLVLNNFTGSYAVVYLGSFEPSIITAAAGGSQIIVYNDTVAHWNATASISGVGNLNLNQSGQSNVTFDLTAATFDHVQRINIGGNGVTAVIDNAVTSGVSYFAGTATNVQISTSEATLDLSHTTLSNVSVVSTNTNGTTFVVRSVSDAAEIFGGSGQDAIQASGFTFSSNERSAIFATASIEAVIDQSGTYYAPAPDPFRG